MDKRSFDSDSIESLNRWRRKWA